MKKAAVNRAECSGRFEIAVDFVLDRSSFVMELGLLKNH